MFIGGIRAVLLQTMHPAAMQAVADHSGYRGDMWGRLARTSQFLAVTTFGTIDHAEQAIRAVRTIHERVTGTMPDGTPYAASDPHLLAWVHAAEVDSFLLAHQTYGARPLDAGRVRRLRRAGRRGRRQAGRASTRRRRWPSCARCSTTSAPSCAPPTRPAAPCASWSCTPTCRSRPARRTPC